MAFSRLQSSVPTETEGVASAVNARRVGRVPKTAAKRVSKAVAQTATKTSNAARRVARKARATAQAA